MPHFNQWKGESYLYERMRLDRGSMRSIEDNLLIGPANNRYCFNLL